MSYVRFMAPQYANEGDLGKAPHSPRPTVGNKVEKHARSFYNESVMHTLDEDSIARIVIPQFLRGLMRTGREQTGDAQTEASFKAGWSMSAWGVIERGGRPLDRKQWRDAFPVLGLTIDDIVQRLDAYIQGNPSIWVEKRPDNAVTICKRPVTSPRGLRSGNILSVDLDPLRPYLYHELSSYFDEDSEVIGAAVSYGYYKAQEARRPSRELPSGITESDEIDRARREALSRAIMGLPREKLGLMERVVDKFTRFSSGDLARAYEHFSLSIRKR